MNMKNLKRILNITTGWVGAILGSSLLCNETGALSIQRKIDRKFLWLLAVLMGFDSSLPTNLQNKHVIKV